jgi:hypothetical protein
MLQVKHRRSCSSSTLVDHRVYGPGPEVVCSYEARCNVVLRIMPDGFIKGGRWKQTLFHEMQPTAMPIVTGHSGHHPGPNGHTTMRSSWRVGGDRQSLSLLHACPEACAGWTPKFMHATSKTCHVSQSSGVSGYCAALL